jgi:hypothetical protein
MIKLVRVGAATAICLMTACTAQPSTSPPGKADVAILVLDQFSAPATPSASPGSAQPGNCLTTGLQANEVGSGGGGGGLPANISHGQAVFDTVAAELGRPGRTLVPVKAAASIDDPNVRLAQAWTYQGHQVLLLGVDTAHYDTQTITNNLGTLIDTLHRSRSIARFVLNMSFYIQPCDLSAWYRDTGNLDQDVTQMLIGYQSILANVPEVAALKSTLDDLTGTHPTVGTLLDDPTLALIRDIILGNLYYGQFATVSPAALKNSEAFQRLASDPLHGFLDSVTTSSTYKVISVGAAGNGVMLPEGTFRQLAFPAAPAMWNSVVSTSSADLADPSHTRTAFYSNSGEVMMAADNPYKAFGTSFAAPHLSALEALYLLNGGPVTCDKHIPPLGYADSDSGVNTWDNLWLGLGSAAGAVQTTGPALGKCAIFESRAT